MAPPNVLPHEDQGAGSPVVFLHGYPLNRTVWKAQTDAPVDKQRAIALDLPGYGQATTVPTPDALYGFTEAVAESIQELASPPAVIVGHSMGGYIALQLYASHPELVRALVLVSTKAEADTEEARAKRLTTISRLRQEGPGPYSVETARQLLSPANASNNPDLFHRVLQIVRSAPVSAMVPSLLALADRPDFTETLKEIQVPTLVIWGEDDRLIPPDATKRLVQGIPKAQGVGIPGAGHLSPMETPGPFGDAIQKFLTSLPTAAPKSVVA
jgi:3-oxoadipate enol-lactonase